MIEKRKHWSIFRTSVLGVKFLVSMKLKTELFTNIKGNPDDAVETPNETKDYTITIEYKKIRVVPSRAAMIKTACQTISPILQKKYLISFVFTAWERYLIHLYMAKQNGENQSTYFAV